MKTALRVLCLCLLSALCLSLLVGCASTPLPSETSGQSLSSQQTPSSDVTEQETAGQDSAQQDSAQQGAALQDSAAQDIPSPQPLPTFAPQPGVTLAQLLDGAEQQAAAGVLGTFSYVKWYGVVDGRMLLCGRGLPDAATGASPWLLAELDAGGQGYRCLPLTLPATARQDLPQTQAALEAPGATPNTWGGQDIVGVFVGEDQQLRVLLCEECVQSSQGEGDVILLQALERGLTLCTVSQEGVLQPQVALQIPQEYLSLSIMADHCLAGPDGSLWLSAYNLAGPYSDISCLLRFSPQDGSFLSAVSLPGNVTLRRGYSVVPVTDDRLFLLCTSAQPSGTNGQPDTAQVGYLIEQVSGDAPALLAQPVWNTRDSLKMLDVFVPALGEQAPEDSCLALAMDGVQRWVLFAPQAETLFQWQALDPSGTVPQILFALEDGRFWALNEVANSAMQLRLLTPTAEG